MADEERTIKVSDATFADHVLAAERPVLVDFYADWCGPCRTMAPFLEDVAEESRDRLTVAKLNVDENPDLARRFDVMSIPTLIVFQDGQPKKRLVGAKGKGQLLQELGEFLESPSR